MLSYPLSLKGRIICELQDAEKIFMKVSNKWKLQCPKKLTWQNNKNLKDKYYYSPSINNVVLVDGLKYGILSIS